ncbi:MAG: Gfo/Idh/MocA family oxidoreductase [Clostridiales bacterium]|nr:Gfo/Idh/MocA family oxidoreductase [Clostridiales bacterium]
MKLVLIGIRGYAKVFMDAMFLNKPGADFEFAGFIYPKSRKSPIPQELIDNKIPQFDSLDEYYENNTADLVIISSPIQLHVTQTIKALENGSNVLCEKPIAATIQDALIMAEASKRTGKFVAVGFQWSFCEPILSLKKDILDGVYGKPISFKTVVQWPRTERYYHRSSWAGKVKNEYGDWILDSVANNATAHFLHNMFFLMGDSISKSAFPSKIKAEMYRANEIENYDTFMAKIKTDNGIDLLFLASHAVPEDIHPVFEIAFEKGKVTFDSAKDRIIYGTPEGGETKVYGNPFEDEMRKIFTSISTINKEDEIPCDIAAASAQLITINAVSENYEISQFAEEYLVREKKEEPTGETTLIYVDGIKDVLMDCYRDEMLPSEKGLPWAVSNAEITVKNYKEFKGVK